MKFPKRVTIIELENAPFKCASARPSCCPVAEGANGRRIGRRRPFVSMKNTVIRPVTVPAASRREALSSGSAFTMPRGEDAAGTVKYEISNIEVLKGNAGVKPLPSDKTSMNVDILLNGVCDVNGAPLLKGKRISK